MYKVVLILNLREIFKAASTLSKILYILYILFVVSFKVFCIYLTHVGDIIFYEHFHILFCSFKAFPFVSLEVRMR